MDRKFEVQIFDEVSASRSIISNTLQGTNFIPIFHSTFTATNYDKIQCGSCCCMFRVEPNVGTIDDILAHSLSRNSKHVILYAERPEVVDVVHAMKLGAVDFLDLPFKELLLVASLNSVIIQKESDLEQTIFASSVASRLTRLTIRERNVLEHVLLGSRNKIIAYKLGISQRTVENHRSRVMNKMGANSIADLINIINSASKKDQ